MSPSFKKWLGALGALVMVASAGSASAQGLRGDYYTLAGQSWSQPPRGNAFGCQLPLFSRVDAAINFPSAVWADAGPINDLDGNPPPVENYPADGFAVRWRGTMTLDSAQELILIAGSDDGMRIWVDDQLVADRWRDTGLSYTASAPINLTAGAHSIVVDYYENGGGNQAIVRVKAAGDETANDLAEVLGEDTLGITLSPAPELPTAADNTAPAAPTNVAASNPTSNSVTVSVTAPGDDGTTGTAGCYDVRYSRTPITEANFASATQVNEGIVVPGAPGSTQTLTVTGLNALEHYYVAVRAGDERGNFGPISNVAEFTTAVYVLPVPSPVPANGVTAEFYTGFGGVCVDNLKNNAKYLAGTPDEIIFYPHFELFGVEDITVLPPGDPRSNYGARMRAFFTPPATGEYQFGGAADDDFELAISVDADGNPIGQGDAGFDPNRLRALAGNDGCDWAPIRDYARNGGGVPDEVNPLNSSVAAPITLTAGKKYLLQGLMKEEGGGDNLAIAAIFPDGTNGTDDQIDWVSTGAAGPRPIAGQYLTPFIPVQSDQGRLRGTVTDANGTPVGGARVAITVGDQTVNVTADGNGFYSTFAPVGAATITATMFPWDASGSANATVTKDQITVTNVTIPFVLPPFIPADVDDSKSDRFEGSLKNIWDFSIDTALDGEAVVQNNRLNISGVGTDIWDGGDAFGFLSQPINDDTFEAVLHIIRAPATDGWSKTGIMARALGDDPATVEALEHHAFAAATRDNGPSGQGRTFVEDTDGTDTNVNTNLGGAFPQDTGYWMKLVRMGQKFWIFTSTDSVNYRFIREIDFSTNTTENPFSTNNILLGIATTTHDTTPDDEDPVAVVDNFLFSGTVASPVPDGGGGTGCKGDANGDGAVNVADAVAILQHAVNIVTLTGQNLQNAKVTAGDAEVNVADAVAVLQAIVGVAPGSELIPNLNCP